MSAGQPGWDAAATGPHGGAVPAVGRAAAPVVSPADPRVAPAKIVATAKVPFPRIDEHARRQRRFKAFGRYGVWCIPIFALASALAPSSSAAFSRDPQAYARYAATGRYEFGELVTIIGLAVLGLLSILTMGALLWQGRARRLAVGGTIIGCVGAAVMLWQVNTLIIRSDQIRHDLFGGDFSRIEFSPQVRGGLALLVVLGGAALLIVAWVMFGVAVFRTGGLSRTDAVLLVISAPMIYAGGLVAGMIPVLGAFLLVAAGLGLGFAAGRVVPAGELDVVPPRRALHWLQRPPDEAPDDFELLPGVSALEPIPATGDAGDTAEAGSDLVERSADGIGRGVPTSWIVTRESHADQPAPPPPPPAAKNFKPVIIMPKSRNDSSATGGAARGGAGQRSGASVKTDLNAKAGNAPAAGPKGMGSGRSGGDRGRDPGRGGGPDWADGKRGGNRGPGEKDQPGGSKGPASGPE